jgi:excisionase family DNA binding protein
LWLLLSRFGYSLEDMAVAINFSEKYHTTAQAAKMLRIATDTVKRYCNQEPQRIRATKVGNSWMIPQSAINEYLSSESDFGRPKNRRRKTG